MPEWSETKSVLITSLGFQDGGSYVSGSWATRKNHNLQLPRGRNFYPGVVVEQTGSFQEIRAKIGPTSQAQKMTDVLNSSGAYGVSLVSKNGFIYLSAEVGPSTAIDRLLTQVHAVHDVAAYLFNSAVTVEGKQATYSNFKPPDKAVLTHEQVNRRQKLIVAAAVVALVVIVAIVGPNVSHSQDKSYNAGFKAGYALRGEGGNASAACNQLWPDFGGAPYDKSLWMSGCESAINS